MYLWAGCKLPEEFERCVRQTCLKLNEPLGLDTAAFSLPQHISLKISFESGQPDAVLDYLTGFLGGQAPFSVRILEPEQMGTILWLPVAENERLQQLHAQLDEQLERRFGIPQHAFDKAFQFHSTLFMDPDTEKLQKMRRLLEAHPLACHLSVDTFLLGVSETGKPGQCRIVRQIHV